MEEKFVVRLYDGFDNEWMDVSKPVTYEEAQKIWNEETENGTQNTKFNDVDYYKIFPADTIMLFSSSGLAENNTYKEKIHEIQTRKL